MDAMINLSEIETVFLSSREDLKQQTSMSP